MKIEDRRKDKTLTYKSLKGGDVFEFTTGSEMGKPCMRIEHGFIVIKECVSNIVRDESAPVRLLNAKLIIED